MQGRTCATRRFAWVVMPEDFLVLLARVFGIAGVMLLATSAALGVLLASRAAQRLRLLKGRTLNRVRRQPLRDKRRGRARGQGVARDRGAAAHLSQYVRVVVIAKSLSSGVLS